MIKPITCKDCGAEFEGEHQTKYCKDCATKRDVQTKRKYYAKKRGSVVRPVKEPVGNIMECTRKAHELGISYGQYMAMQRN